MTHFKKLILTTLLVLFTLSAAAMDLNTAKSRGFLGEQQNGYLGLVNPSAPGDAKSVIAKQRFTSISASLTDSVLLLKLPRHPQINRLNCLQAFQ